MSAVLIKEINRKIDEAKDKLELANAAERLMSNKDFIKVVKEGYFKEKALDLLNQVSDPVLQNEEIQKLISKEIFAIGSFNRYLNEIQEDKEELLNSIHSDTQTINEIINEESN